MPKENESIPARRITEECQGALHPKAIEGIHLFNEGKYFEAHEELETAWREETGAIRDLYRGILQVAVTYLHITRGNYDGAVKVYGRSLKWTRGWNDVCRGVNIKKLRNDAEITMKEVERLGKERIRDFDVSLFQPIQWNEKRLWLCDRCGSEMHEKNCKVTCLNCGNRFDCSDLNLYFD
jgi:predicted metal-dependent hydrolase